MRLFSMFFAWLFSWGEPEEKNQPEIEPSYLTTDSADPGDTAEPSDTSEEEPEETGTTETGDSGSGDTADSGDTATTTDTALKSAMELSGENGGFGCATVSADAAVSIWLGVMALGLRRRED